MADANAKPDCIFCNIITGQNKDASILYKDEDIIIIKDKFPIAEHHILVIPIRHINNATHLKPEDINLVKKMEQHGHNKMKDLNANINDLRVGINWPPINTVEHLHQHFISPGSTLSFLRSFFFSQRNPWFVSTEYLLRRLSK